MKSQGLLLQPIVKTAKSRINETIICKTGYIWNPRRDANLASRDTKEANIT